MAQVKKAFQPLVDILTTAMENNAKVKVSEVIEQVIAEASAKSASRDGTTFIKNAAGETVAIHDYYFKRWMPLVGNAAVEFGKKEKTGSGYNTMSKTGQNLWNKQLREAKNAEAGLLKEVAAGNIQPSDIPAKQKEIEDARKHIEVTEDGFATKAEVLAYLKDNGVEVDAESAEGASE